jgi:hypothetical protein
MALFDAVYGKLVVIFLCVNAKAEQPNLFDLVA